MCLEYTQLRGKILNSADYILAKGAKLLRPKYCGIYCIRIINLYIFPKEIIQYQQSFAKNENIIYIGMANPVFLEKRLLKQDLSGTGAAIFFRKLGSVLGYSARPGKNPNYKFFKDDKIKIIEWIDENLSVKYFKYSADKYSKGKTKNEYESPLICEFSPAFNFENNDNECDFITEVHRKNLSLIKSGN